MAYPLLVPREQCHLGLLWEEHLRPLVAIKHPQAEHICGGGCRLWRGLEVFATDDVPVETVDRLRGIRVTVHVVSTPVWADGVGCYRYVFHAIRNLHIYRWVGDAESMPMQGIIAKAAYEGMPEKEACRHIGLAYAEGLITRSKRDPVMGYTYALAGKYRAS